LKELRCGRLSPQAIGGEEKFVKDKGKHFQPREPRLIVIDDLQEISIVKQDLLNLDSKVSL
jgi:hypothetical protein